MTDQEYSQWVLKDSFKELGKGLLIYTVALALYWTFIG
jgi:hypothetical protein